MLEDIRSKWDPMAYVQAVIRHAKSVNLNTDNQLLAWRNLDVQLQRNVPKSTTRGTVSGFIDILEDRKEV